LAHGLMEQYSDWFHLTDSIRASQQDILGYAERTMTSGAASRIGERVTATTRLLQELERLATAIITKSAWQDIQQREIMPANESDPMRIRYMGAVAKATIGAYDALQVSHHSISPSKMSRLSDMMQAIERAPLHFSRDVEMQMERNWQR